MQTATDYLRGFSPLKSPGAFGGLNQEFSQRLAGMLAQAPDYVRTPSLLESLYRSPEDQARAIKSVADRNGIPFHLGLMRTGIPGMAAPVGSSKHQDGIAADFNFATTDPRVKQWVYENAPRYGISFPLPGTDSGHGELDPKFYGPVRPFDLDSPAGPSPAAPPVSVPQRSASPSPLPIPGAPPMQSPQQDQGWLGLLSDRFQSPLFMMGASIFNQAYQPGGNIGAGMMEGLQASNMMQRQRRRDMREQAQFDQAQAAGPLLQSAFQNGEPDIGALLANPATRDIGLTLYKEKTQQNDPLRQAQVTYYGAQARKAEADANRKEDPDAIFRQRERIADQQGLPAGSPERRQFVLTGELPKGERQTSTDKKEILEGVQTAQSGQSAISLLNQAKQLSGQAYSGAFAKQYGTVLDATIGGKAAQATVELDQIVTSQALEQLKATFGGAPTEGERKILLQIQGAANLSRASREAIYDRAIKLAQVRVEYENAKAEAIRDGSIYKPGFKMPTYQEFAARLGLDLNADLPSGRSGEAGKTAPGEPLPKGGQIRILGVREPGAR